MISGFGTTVFIISGVVQDSWHSLAGSLLLSVFQEIAVELSPGAVVLSRPNQERISSRRTSVAVAGIRCFLVFSC